MRSSTDQTDCNAKPGLRGITDLCDGLGRSHHERKATLPQDGLEERVERLWAVCTYSRI